MESEHSGDAMEVEDLPQTVEPPKSGSRRWCFRISDYVCEDEWDEHYGWVPVGPPAVYALARCDKTIKAFVCGQEVSPTTRMPHLQGYLELKSLSTLEAMLKKPLFASEKALGHSVWLGAARAYAPENIRYCSKFDQDPELWGVFTEGTPGKRNDWHEMRRLAETDAPVADFFEAAPHLAMPHHNKIAGWKGVYCEQKVRTWKTVPKIFLGPPRVGKSTSMRAQAQALAEAEGWRVYTKSDSDKWWPGYDGQEIILIDEAHGGFWQWQALLRFFEEGQLTVQYKGGSTDFLGRVVFMTTNTHPAFWYKNKEWDDTNAFRARIEEFGELWVFRARTAAEKAAKQYPPPERDFALDPPEGAVAVAHVSGQSDQLEMLYGMPN